jgi:tetratricopeptide (TPR) repeat protein
MARAGLADAFQQLGRRGDAIAAYEQALAAQGDRGDWWYHLGRLRLDSGRDREAAQAFEQAAALEADLPPTGAGNSQPEWAYESHRYLGDSLRRRRPQEALTHYRRYLELAPDTALDRAEVEGRVESMSR